MQDMDAELQEYDHEFVLTATIPEHERKGLAVSVRGNEVVLSGNRRSSEKLDLGPGRVQNTSSFQTFSESFPINWPVDARSLTREFDGDQLIVRIPKKKTYEPAPYKAKRVERAKLERPTFPENIPLGAVKKKTTPDGPLGSNGNSGNG